MIQDQYTDTPTRTDTRFASRPLAHHSPLMRGLRYVFFGLGFALVLSCLEGICWMANPGGLFGGSSSSHSFTAFLALPVHMPLLLAVPAIEVLVGIWLVWTLAQPLALLAYLKVVFQAQESYRVRHTPLQSWSYPYDTPVHSILADPDPTRPRREQILTPLGLIEALLISSHEHLLVPGASGAGKTMLVHEYLSALAQRRRQIAFGRLRVPLYVPLKYYALLLQSSELTDAADFSLLAFLETCELPGLVHVRPYLSKLFRQGRLLLLCDGLDEVPATYRPPLVSELSGLFRQTRNSLLLTCTPELLEQENELAQAVEENLVARAELRPLEAIQVRSVVERFITELDTSYRPNLPTAGQVMNLFERSRLRLICTNPLYLFALLACVAHQPLTEVKRLDTRGRLLHAFLLNRLETAQSATSDELLFLRELACVARCKGDSDVLSLPVECFQIVEAAEQADGNERTIQQVLVQWAREQQVYFPFARETVFSLAETLPTDQAATLLQSAYRAGLIDLNGQGILSFRHPLIVSALLAEYLSGFLGGASLRVEEIETLPGDLLSWSEPLALWAGLLSDPQEAAEALAVYARDHPEQRVRALGVSLICLGVAQTPPGVEPAQPLQVPPTLELVLNDLLDDLPALEELAALLQDCAAQDTPELYQALFPLLLIERSEVFIRLLDPAALSEQFFQRLMDCIDDLQQDVLVKRLVRALSSWGAAIVPRAAWLCSGRAGVGGRLRTAAINVLGGTQAEEAVEPLMTCLRDSEAFIVRRASNALLRLGADLTLTRLLQELEDHGTSPPLHEQIFPILERFLSETNPARQLRPEQFEQINEALMSLLTTQTDPADLEKARTLLVGQGRLAEERASGKIAIRMLVQNLATADDAAARSVTGALKEMGSVATPSLLEQLEERPSEAERVRILEVLASVRDERALPALLRLLSDSSPAVQQTLETTLAVYAPDSVPGLIDAILHHEDELVAQRAELILGKLGLVAVDPVVRALIPLVPGRTLLLVNVLESVGEKRAVPPLVLLLRAAQSDVSLALTTIQALGQFDDERAVRPLMTPLASTNPLLYEGAINALSNLGELACPELLTGLDTVEKTPLVARIQRALLGMQPFPGELLLNIVEEMSEEQLEHLEAVFLERGIDAAQVLALNLFHPQPQTRAWVRRVMEKVDGRYAVPALLEVLPQSDPARRELLASYLLRLPQEAISPLVGLLDDPERGEAAAAILLKAGRPVLSALLPALDMPQGVAQARAISLFLTMVREQNELVEDVVQLFALTPPPRACETLMQVLSEDLAELSLLALLAGLEDAHLVRDVSATLVRLAQRDAAWLATVLEELLQALRLPNRRHGAAATLVDLGNAAIAGVGALITEADAQVARVARQILGEIGTPAFSFLWAAYSDASHPVHREAAREVFRTMPTSTIKDELVVLLTSARPEEISMALALLLERIHDETLQSGRASEMLPALLEYVQSSSDERASLRILALLLLLGGPLVAQPLVDALYANAQGHEHLVQAFLLLGQGVEGDLQAILQDDSASNQLQAEVAGILAMRFAGAEMQELALNLSEHGLWAGRSTHGMTAVLQQERLDISLRTLGGLLVAGHWGASELQDMRAANKVGSPQRELLDILLGWRYSPEIMRLQHELETERQERNQELIAYTQELLLLKRQTIDLEHDLEILRKEHEEQHVGHEQKSKELQEAIANLNQMKQQLQAELHQTTQEKQTLTMSTQQAVKEKERLQAEAQRWQTYSQQLERDLSALRRPGSAP